MPTIHLLVKGKVQGVFYRANTKKKAEELGVKGWVKNTPEGDVEIMAQATPEALKEFTDWCHDGPPAANVTHVHVTEKEESWFDKFYITK